MHSLVSPRWLAFREDTTPIISVEHQHLILIAQVSLSLLTDQEDCTNFARITKLGAPILEGR